MAITYSDVLRVEGAEATLVSTTLRNKQVGFGTDGQHRQVRKNAAGTADYWTADGYAVTYSNVTIGEYLYHDGDPDTYLRYTANGITLSAGGNEIYMHESGINIPMAVSIGEGYIFPYTGGTAGQVLYLIDANTVGFTGVPSAAASSGIPYTGAAANWMPKVNAAGNSLLNSAVYETGANMYIVSDSAGANGPFIRTVHDSASPGYGDVPGYISFYGKTTSGASVPYGQVIARIIDPDDSFQNLGCVSICSGDQSGTSEKLRVDTRFGVGVYNSSLNSVDTLQDWTADQCKAFGIATGMQGAGFGEPGQGYGVYNRNFGQYGGIALDGKSSHATNGAVAIRSYNVNDPTTTGAIVMDAFLQNGVGTTGIAYDSNVLKINNNSTNVANINGNGDVDFIDSSTTSRLSITHGLGGTARSDIASYYGGYNDLYIDGDTLRLQTKGGGGPIVCGAGLAAGGAVTGISNLTAESVKGLTGYFPNAKIETLRVDKITGTTGMFDYLGTYGTFTMGLTGILSDVTPTAEAKYIIQGRVVHLYIPVLLGTSNSNAKYLTNIPAAIRPTSQGAGQTFFPLLIRDNASGGVGYAMGAVSIGNSDYWTLYSKIDGSSYASWGTESGFAGLQCGAEITYMLD